MEERTARNWYRWLWLSPLATLPTFFVFALVVAFVMEAILRGGPQDDYIMNNVVLGLVVWVSSLWHLILLVPARNTKSEFVRWHGRQMLLLAGIRTIVPLGFALAFGLEEELTLLAIPVLIAIWLVGTLLGQRQAARGQCGLMRWFGRADAQPSRVDALVDVIRFSRDPKERSEALAKLAELGRVEPL